MSEGHERCFTYGAAPVQYHNRETWTEEVKVLYKRLQEWDYFVLADLLRKDIEFLADDRAMATLKVLKYSPDLPNKRCRSELRRIAQVIACRPGRRRRKLPYGDRLESELNGLVRVIERQRLLEVKNDPLEIQRRVEDALRNPMLEKWEEHEIGVQLTGMSKRQIQQLFKKDRGTVLQDRRQAGSRRPVPESQREEIARVVSALNHVVRVTNPRVKSPRSWTLQAMADHYGTGTKVIDQAIRREIRAGRRRRQSAPQQVLPQ